MNIYVSKYPLTTCLQMQVTSGSSICVTYSITYLLELVVCLQFVV